MTLRVGRVYINALNERLRIVRADRSGVNRRVEARNLTTGQLETWSTRLFLGAHTRDGRNAVAF